MLRNGVLTPLNWACKLTSSSRKCAEFTNNVQSLIANKHHRKNVSFLYCNGLLLLWLLFCTVVFWFWYCCCIVIVAITIMSWLLVEYRRPFNIRCGNPQEIPPQILQYTTPPTHTLHTHPPPPHTHTPLHTPLHSRTHPHTHHICLTIHPHLPHTLHTLYSSHTHTPHRLKPPYTYHTYPIRSTRTHTPHPSSSLPPPTLHTHPNSFTPSPHPHTKMYCRYGNGRRKRPRIFYPF